MQSLRVMAHRGTLDAGEASCVLVVPPNSVSATPGFGSLSRETAQITKSSTIQVAARAAGSVAYRSSISGLPTGPGNLGAEVGKEVAGLSPAGELDQGGVTAVLGDAPVDSRPGAPPVARHVPQELPRDPVENAVGVLAFAVAQPALQDAEQTRPRRQVEEDSRRRPTTPSPSHSPPPRSGTGGSRSPRAPAGRPPRCRSSRSGAPDRRGSTTHWVRAAPGG